MREIKFRARDSNKWVYSDEGGLSDFFFGLEDGQFDGETLGESTGLKDKSRKLIFEGDIIEWPTGSRQIVKYEPIEMEDGSSCLGYDLDPKSVCHAKVIGNIYEGHNEA